MGIDRLLPGFRLAPARHRRRADGYENRIRELPDREPHDSVWLPAAFNPVSVQGVRDVSYDSASASLITSKKTSNGLDYSVTSYQYLSSLNSATLEAAPPLTDLGTLSAYLKLPNTVAPAVLALAQRITAGKTTEYDKALALQDYLRSPPFTYNLHPKSDGSGNEALYNFLFNTQQGYCQQYAGAYAVLARAAGLPTRLAVGFATGTPIAGGNSYQVYDSDAHTWPEVYFGPKYGWLPFEPTPGYANPSSSNYAPTTPSSSPTTPDTLPLAPKGTPSTAIPKAGNSASTSSTTLSPPREHQLGAGRVRAGRQCRRCCC